MQPDTWRPWSKRSRTRRAQKGARIFCGFRTEELRGVLRLGLVAGDHAMIVNRSEATRELKIVDLVKNMSASAAESRQAQPGRSYDFDGLQQSTEFVISPPDTIFVSMGGYDSSSCLRLEDQLADTVVKLHRI